MTPDTQHISVMDKSFGLKLQLIKHLSLGYLQTAAEHRFVLKARAKILKIRCGSKQKFTGFIDYHKDSIESHQQKEDNN